MKYSIALLTAMLLVGCGGGGSSESAPVNESQVETVTGTFVDAEVEGLGYVCSSGTRGITNALGEYTCDKGETVSFFIAQQQLGQAMLASQDIITPYDIFTDSIEKAVNLARLLQTLDTDPDEDKITLNRSIIGMLTVPLEFDEEDFDEKVEFDLQVTLVGAEEAQRHMDDSVEDAGGTVPVIDGHTIDDGGDETDIDGITDDGTDDADDSDDATDDGTSDDSTDTDDDSTSGGNTDSGDTSGDDTDTGGDHTSLLDSSRPPSPF